MTQPARPISSQPVGDEASPASGKPRNAYFLSLRIEGVRCFLQPQTLNLQAQTGPARWTLILGENGTGKTTLLQLLAENVATNNLDARDFAGIPNTLATRHAPRLFFSRDAYQRFARIGARYLQATAEVLRTDQLGPEGVRDSGTTRLAVGGGRTDPFRDDDDSVVYGYGAARRQAPPGLTTTNQNDPTRTLFDDQATLRNPEEWLLQAELAASMTSPLQVRARQQVDRVKGILTRVLPEVDDIRVTTGKSEDNAIRAVAEVHGPDGWIPFSALGLGYRTMTAWMVDFASRLFERYGDLADPLAGAAVCLVDEIDLHLHPRWQRQLIDRLTALFPNTQFIATAHSPLVVQAARDANLVVLKRVGDHVDIDNAPRSVRNWRLDQILTSELFDVPSARPPEFDELLRERDALLGKAQLTEGDERRLAELRSRIGELPSGDTPEDIEAMDVIRRAAAALKNKPG